MMTVRGEQIGLTKMVYMIAAAACTIIVTISGFMMKDMHTQVVTTGLDVATIKAQIEPLLDVNQRLVRLEVNQEQLKYTLDDHVKAMQEMSLPGPVYKIYKSIPPDTRVFSAEPPPPHDKK